MSSRKIEKKVIIRKIKIRKYIQCYEYKKIKIWIKENMKKIEKLKNFYIQCHQKNIKN